jgi:ankyrin repeat protein
MNIFSKKSVKSVKDNLDRNLQTAVSENNLQQVQNLLSKGANPNSYGNLALAVHNQNINIVKVLVEHGANVNGNVEMSIPIPLAIAYDIAGNEDIVRYLLEQGAEVNQTMIDACRPEYREMLNQYFDAVGDGENPAYDFAHDNTGGKKSRKSRKSKKSKKSRKSRKSRKHKHRRR